MVLSQNNEIINKVGLAEPDWKKIQMDNENDGYLTVDEVAKLKLKADLVNLSGCETGLAKYTQERAWLDLPVPLW